MKQIIQNNNYKRKPIITDNSELLRIANSNVAPKNIPNVNQEPTKQNEIIHQNDSYWTLERVKHNGQLYTVDLKKELLPRANFDKTIENTKLAIQSGDFYTAPMNFYYSIFSHLYQNQSEKNTEEIKEFIKTSMKEKWLNTTTRLNYKKGSLEAEISHNFNLPNQENFREKIINLDGYVKNLDEKKLYQALLGESDNKKINEVFNWLTDKDLYLWRLNHKNDFADRIRVVRFYSDDDNSSLDCYGSSVDGDVSLGVRYVIPHGQK